MLPIQWRKMGKRKRKIAIHALRFYWFTNHPIIRPLLIANILIWLLPSHVLALPTSIGIGFSMEVFIRSFEKITWR